MTPEVKAACENVIALVKEKRNELKGRPASLDEIHDLLQAVVSFMGYVSEPLIDGEIAYNKLVAQLMQVEDYTAAKATIIAKTSTEYRDYRYIEYVYKFADTEQMLLKKLLGSKEKEFYL